MFKRYCAKLIFRICVFAAVLYAYFIDPEMFDYVLTYEVHGPILGIYVVWGIFMISMILHMFPNNGITMGSKKRFASEYHEIPGYDHLALYEYKRRNDLAALKVLVVWLFFNAIIGCLYLAKILQVKELIVIVSFYYVCDLVCVVIWCPFQNFFMKNKCCVNCRIFNWGHFMMFTPFLFVPRFLTWSLFFTAVILLLRWEAVYLQHPERFWENSNAILRCNTCQDKLCAIKTARFLDLINLEAGPRYDGEDITKYIPDSLRDVEGNNIELTEKLKNIYEELIRYVKK